MGRGAPCRPIGGSGEGVALDLVAPTIGIVNQIPVPGSAILGGVAPLPDNPVIPFRGTMNFNILGFAPQDNIVSEVYIEETLGYELPFARVKLINENKQISSIMLAKEQTSFKVVFGYDNPGIKSHGTYIVQRPKFKFMKQGADLAVEVTGYGEMVKMAATERRAAYKKQRDSDIARTIANRNGFSAEIEPTDHVHDQVIQANESDYKFLARRAMLYGYLLYVEDGVMHFHRPRPRNSGLILTYLEGDESNLMSFAVQSRTFMRGLQLRLTQIDPLTKEEFEVDSTETPDAVQSVTDYQNWKEMVSIPGVGQPTRYITNEGHEQFRALLKDQIVRMAQASRYVVSGVGETYGLEALRPNDLLTINGIGRSSGRYYVTKTVHRVSGQTAYTTTFEVVRSGAGQLAAFNTTGTPVELQEESIVRL